MLRESLRGEPNPDLDIRDTFLETMMYSLNLEECLGNRQERGRHSRQRKQQLLGYRGKGGYGILRKNGNRPNAFCDTQEVHRKRAKAGDG